MSTKISLDQALAEEGGELPAIKLLDPLQLDGKPIPLRKWLAPGLIPWGNVTLLGGDGGLGKSLLCLQLQVAAALGRPWIGQVVAPVKSLGFYCEDDADELHRRLAAIAEHYGSSLGDLENLLAAPRVGTNNILARPFDGEITPTRLYDSLLRQCKDFGAQLLILDTAADVFGGNENWRDQVRSFNQILRRLALEIDGVVVLTAHPSKDGLATGSGISGSTAWNASVRSRLYLTRPKVDDGEGKPPPAERVLRHFKANYSGLQGDILLTYQDGAFVAEDRPGGILKTITDRNVERAFLACLDAATAQGRNVSDYKSAPNFAPRVFARMREAERARQRDLDQAMHRLFAAGEIIMGSPFAGPDRKPRRGIVRDRSS